MVYRNNTLQFSMDLFVVNETCLPNFLIATYLSHFHKIYPILRYGLSDINTNLSEDIITYIGNIIISLCTF